MVDREQHEGYVDVPVCLARETKVDDQDSESEYIIQGIASSELARSLVQEIGGLLQQHDAGTEDRPHAPLEARFPGLSSTELWLDIEDIQLTAFLWI